MPQPMQLTPGTGRLAADASFRLALEGYREARLEVAPVRLILRLERETGIPFSRTLETDQGKATLVVHSDHAGEAVQSVHEDESYQLDVTPRRARCR